MKTRILTFVAMSVISLSTLALSGANCCTKAAKCCHPGSCCNMSCCQGSDSCCPSGDCCAQKK